MIEINQCRYIVRDTPHLSDFRTSPVIYHSPIDATDETPRTVIKATIPHTTYVTFLRHYKVVIYVQATQFFLILPPNVTKGDRCLLGYHFLLFFS